VIFINDNNIMSVYDEKYLKILLSDLHNLGLELTLNELSETISEMIDTVKKELRKDGVDLSFYTDTEVWAIIRKAILNNEGNGDI